MVSSLPGSLVGTAAFFPGGNPHVGAVRPCLAAELAGSGQLGFRNTRGSVRGGVYSAMRGGRFCSTRGLATHCLQKTFGAISSQSADTSRYAPLAGDGWAEPIAQRNAHRVRV